MRILINTTGKTRTATAPSMHSIRTPEPSSTAAPSSWRAYQDRRPVGPRIGHLGYETKAPGAVCGFGGPRRAAALRHIGPLKSEAPNERVHGGEHRARLLSSIGNVKPLFPWHLRQRLRTPIGARIRPRLVASPSLPRLLRVLRGGVRGGHDPWRSRRRGGLACWGLAPWSRPRPPSAASSWWSAWFTSSAQRGFQEGFLRPAVLGPS